MGTERGSDNVVAGGRLGTPWRARKGSREEEQGRGRGR
jgi:hypothetical protein